MTAGYAGAIKIRLNLVDILSQPGDPTAGGGVSAVIGSLYSREGTPGAYQKTAAGNTAWTILNQSFHWYSVRDYGAAGDGVADDRVPINNAIIACNAAGGGVVYAPRGTYLMSKDGANPYSIDMNAMANVIIVGQGSATVFKQSGNAGAAAWSLFRIRGNASKIRFEDVTFDGSGLSNPAASRQNHLVEIGDGTGSPTEIQFFRCRFQNTVANAGDGLHLFGAAGNLVQRVWVLDSVFESIARYGVGVEQGVSNLWVCDSYLTGCEREIAFVSTAAGVTQDVVITGNEIIHTHATERRAVSLVGHDTDRINAMAFNNNVILNGFVEITNVADSTFVGNVQTSGVYASTDASWRVTRRVSHLAFSGNVWVRTSGAGVGACFSMELADAIQPTIVRCGNNTLVQEVTAAPFIYLLDPINVSVGDNICRSSNAGATAVDAIDVQAVNAAVDGVQLVGNQMTAAAGTFRSAIRLLCNGANIVNVQMVDNQADQIDVGIRYEDAGGGSLTTGQLMDATNLWDAATADYSEVGTTVFPYIGLNASAVGTTYRTGNGSPEGVVTARVGSLYARRDGGQDTAFYYKETGTGAAGWVPCGGGPVVFGIGDAGTVATALYFAPGFTTATAGATELQINLPRPGTVRNLRVHVTGAGTDAATVTYTVRKNGVDTTLLTTLGNTATGNAVDTTHTFTVVAGDLLSISITKSGAVTAGQTNVTATVELI